MWQYMRINIRINRFTAYSLSGASCRPSTPLNLHTVLLGESCNYKTDTNYAPPPGCLYTRLFLPALFLLRSRRAVSVVAQPTQLAVLAGHI